uniref:Uncharacterized protein n=1 Tax=uncultured organism TaxID=155900 RepID=M1QBG7_9ZZZZ|nr:hypothetical protein FLSS-23_0008 [uncultured organism]
MNLVLILTILVLILVLYSIGITILHLTEREERSTSIAVEDIDYKLDYIQSRLKKIRRETPSYIDLDIKDR